MSANEFGFLRLDGRKKASLFRQLYQQLRLAILDGRLRAGIQVPSSRDLMGTLNVSRTTVVTAINLLVDEGYLVTRRGKGTFVASEIPDHLLIPKRSKDSWQSEPQNEIDDQKRLMSRFGASVGDLTRTNGFSSQPIPLCPGEPALDEFPLRTWQKIQRRFWNRATPADLTYGDPAGYPPLREQVAEYLNLHRGANCDASQVMIVNGTQQVLHLVSQVTLDEGDFVVFENPGYQNAGEAFRAFGAKTLAAEIDAFGAVPVPLKSSNRRIKFAYLTPSHQFPLGVTMPIERRFEWIEWARSNQTLILEDDYDSEYRYHQKPIPCLQGLDHGQHTIYVGSFSKVICPALGIGYAILPTKMIRPFEQALRLASRPPSKVEQIALSEFIRQGHFVRHLRRMRKIHGERRDCFLETVEKQLGDYVTMNESAAGLHSTLVFRGDVDDVLVSQQLLKNGVIGRPLSTYYASSTEKTNRQQGLVVGFACATNPSIRKAITRIRKVLNDLSV